MRGSERPRAVAAALATTLLLAPLGVLVMGALHAPGAAPPTGWELIPTSPTVSAFERADALVGLGTELVNSLMVVAVAVPVSVIVASWAGFALALMEGRARRRAVAIVLVMLVVPVSAVWVPRFVMAAEVGLIDHPLVLALPALMGTTPFAVLLFYWSFRRIPRELVDAARLEGASPLRIWRTVAAPLARPTTVAVAAIVFVAHWGNFVDALLYLYTPERFTLPLALNQLRILGPTEVPTILAAALVATIPPVVAFVLAQRKLIEATRGAGWLGR